MITKGIIEQVVNNYSVKVRLPVIDKIKDAAGSTPTNALSESCICTLPNCSITPRVDDVVFVAFEDNNFGKPFVLGYLFSEQVDNSTIDIIANSLEVTGKSKLSADTIIGEVDSKGIESLKGCDFNIKDQIDLMNDKISNLESKVSKLEELLNNQIQLNSDIAIITMGQSRMLSYVCEQFDKLHHTDTKNTIISYPINVGGNKNGMSRFVSQVPSKSNNFGGGVGDMEFDIPATKNLYKCPKIKNIDGSNWGEKSFGEKYTKAKNK